MSGVTKQRNSDPVRAWHEDGTPAENLRYYKAQWHAYARRRYAALFLLFTWPAACFGLFWLSRMWLHLPLVAIAVMMLWLAGALWLVWWSGEFRCPRCRRRFGALGRRSTITRGIFDPLCNNCKLRKGEIG